MLRNKALAAAGSSKVVGMSPDYYQRELVTAVSHAISTVGNEEKDPNVGF